METRLNYAKARPDAFKAMMALENAARATSIEAALAELIRMRVSQMNGCAFCMDMHAHDMIQAGERPQRIFVLNGWHDSPLFTPRERAALAWAEALTTLPSGHPDDALYDALDPHFTDAEKVDLTLLIVAINGWNRFGVGFRMVHPARDR
ncbi:carboxymuconolactone decarboxylase family protein [Sphingobium aquiterrae]|uniref:carboxymuconolactone decarboxylase family protein n=1 Tax=Sphingobium aquiterrae TaxID=2038656 RepID=UPI00301AAB62